MMKNAGIFHRIRLKYLGRIEMGQSPPSSAYSRSAEDGLPFLQGTVDFGALSPTPQVYCGTPTKLARAGDILFSVRAPVGEINLADQDYGIGRGLCAISPRAGWNPRFAWWALHEARYQLSFVATGSTYEAVAAEDVGNLFLEYGPEHIQCAIADYVDRKVARTDVLIAEKERVLELLAEKRRALITRAVTWGLDANVPGRESGIPWLGKIPSHWEVVRFRWHFGIGSGGFISPNDICPDPNDGRVVPVIGGNGLTGYTNCMNANGTSIVIGRVGALCGNVHFVEGPVWVTDNALLLREIRSFKRTLPCTLA